MPTNEMRILGYGAFVLNVAPGPSPLRNQRFVTFFPSPVAAHRPGPPPGTSNVIVRTSWEQVYPDLSVHKRELDQCLYLRQDPDTRDVLLVTFNGAPSYADPMGGGATYRFPWQGWDVDYKVLPGTWNVGDTISTALPSGPEDANYGANNPFQYSLSIDAEETVIVPAGTYDCYRTTIILERPPFSGHIGRRSTSTYWFHPPLGMYVKAEGENRVILPDGTLSSHTQGDGGLKELQQVTIF